MKKITLLLLSLYTICCGLVYASEQDMLDSFTQFADSQIQPIKESYKTGKYEIRQFLDPPKGNECGLPCGYFYKIQYINLQASYDVKKTYSLLNPYVGTILMSNDKLFYYSNDNTFGKYATETEAEEANLARRKDGAKMKFLYVYRDGQWILNKVINYTDNKSGSKAGLEPPPFYFLVK